MAKGNKLAVAGLAAGALWLLSRSRADTEHTVEFAEGSIKFITLRQGKRPGDSLILIVGWTPSTVNFLNQPIAWDYRVAGDLLFEETGQPILHAEYNFDALPNKVGGTPFETVISSSSGPFKVPPRDLSYGTQYFLQAKVTIYAKDSDIDGKPIPGKYSEKDARLSNALLINQDQSAKPSVTITGSTVS